VLALVEHHRAPAQLPRRIDANARTYRRSCGGSVKPQA
jgi:hypothetical protein